MGQCDKSLRLWVVDPDETFRTELRSLMQAGIGIVFAEPAALVDPDTYLTNGDVVVVCVETPARLALVADICARPDAPPVLAIAGVGFEGKSLEHVLLLAELRGAMAGLPKPIEGPELVLAATQAQGRVSRRAPQTVRVSESKPKLARVV